MLGFQLGGDVPGVRGESRLAVVHAGERVLSAEERERFLGEVQGTRVELNMTLVGDVNRATREAIRAEARLIGNISRERLRVEGVI